jgi:hypothetical protein
MFVRQKFAGWVGVVVDGIVYNGAISAEVTISLNKQLETIEPTEKELRALKKHLREGENLRILEMVESNIFA